MTRDDFRDNLCRATVGAVIGLKYNFDDVTIKFILPQIEELDKEVRYFVTASGSKGPPYLPFPPPIREFPKYSGFWGPLKREEVIDLLWRDEAVPHWIDVYNTPERHDLVLVASGSWTSKYEHLYYLPGEKGGRSSWLGCPPFQILGGNYQLVGTHRTQETHNEQNKNAAIVSSPVSHTSELRVSFLGVIGEALKSSYKRIRLIAVRALHLMGDPTLVKPFITAAFDEDMCVQRAAADALASFNSESAVEAIIAVIGAAEELDLFNLLRALGKINSQRAEDYLVDLVRSTADPQVKRYAISALCYRWSPAIELAIREALTDSDSEVRVNAVISLGFKDDVRVIPLLEEALYDPSESVQMLAACSMAQLGNSLALPCILRRLDCNVSSGSASQQIAFLCDVIEFSEQDARAAAAVAALQLIGGEQVVPVIESLLRNRQHLLLRYLCSLALERLNTPGAIASLISIIDDCQYDIFSDPTFPVSALSNIKCVEAVPALVIMANSHHDSGRQCSAIHALGQIGGAEAETAVRNALEAQASSVRDAALTALGAFKNPDYIPILASFLKKRDHLNSRHAVDAIWKIGGERALEALYDRILEYSTHPNLL